MKRLDTLPYLSHQATSHSMNRRPHVPLITTVEAGLGDNGHSPPPACALPGDRWLWCWPLIVTEGEEARIRGGGGFTRRHFTCVGESVRRHPWLPSNTALQFMQLPRQKSYFRSLRERRSRVRFLALLGCIAALHLVILVTTARSKQRLTENGWKNNPKIGSCFCMWV